MSRINWFAGRSLNATIQQGNLTAYQMTTFVDLLPSISTILDGATARVAAVTTDNRVSITAVIASIGDIIRDGYTMFHRQAEATGTEINPSLAKASVMLMVDEFYKNVVAPLDIPYVPALIENTFVDPAIGKVFHEAASAIYDSVVAALNAIPPAMLGTPSPSGPGTVYTETRPVNGALAPNPMPDVAESFGVPPHIVEGKSEESRLVEPNDK